MRDCSDEPYFIKKAEKAKETIKKYGLPKSVRRSNNPNSTSVTNWRSVIDVSRWRKDNFLNVFKN